MPHPATLPDLLVMDFETCGTKQADGKFNVQLQQPTEVVALRVVQGEVVSVFNTLIQYMGPWTEHLAGPQNHHTQAELRNGMPLDMVCDILWSMMYSSDHNNPIVVAYNALFDLQVYWQMLINNGEEGAADQFKYSVDFIDPLTIARDRHPYPHKLGYMCQHYGIELQDAHLAMDDGLALAQLVCAMHEEEVNGKEEGILGYVNQVGYLRKYGAPIWTPDKAIVKPQGSETIYHQADGSTTTTRPKSSLRRAVPRS